MRLAITAALAAALAAAACGGPRSEVASACNARSDMTAAECDCIAKRAVAELSDEQRAQLVQLIREEEDADVPVSAMLALAPFMTGAALACAGSDGEG